MIVDEAHRARRRNRPKTDAGQPEVDERAEPNKLMSFLCQIGEKTKSMLLATATPVQLHPVEAWDLLSILSNGNEGVLGAVDFIMVPIFKATHDVLTLVNSFSPIDALSTGRSVTWMTLLRAVLQIWGLIGGIFAAFGILAFTRRELATAQGKG